MARNWRKPKDTWLTRRARRDCWKIRRRKLGVSSKHLRVSYHEIHQRYEAELKREKQKNDTLQQQLKTEMKSGAERLLEHQEQIQGEICHLLLSF